MESGVTEAVKNPIASFDIGEKTFAACKANKINNTLDIASLELTNLRRFCKNAPDRHVKKQTTEVTLERLNEWWKRNSESMLECTKFYAEDQQAARQRMKAIFTSLWSHILASKSKRAILKKSDARRRYDYLYIKWPPANLKGMENFNPKKKYWRGKYNVALVEYLIAQGVITGNYLPFLECSKKDDLAVSILQIIYEEGM